MGCVCASSRAMASLKASRCLRAASRARCSSWSLTMRASLRDMFASAWSGVGVGVGIGVGLGIGLGIGLGVGG